MDAARVVFPILCFALLSCGTPVPIDRSPRAQDASTPAPIPACQPSFEHITQLAENGQTDRVRIAAESKDRAFFAGYFFGGAVTRDGMVTQIRFDDAADPAVLDVDPVGDGRAWFLLREPWFFDGTQAVAVPAPDDVTIDALSAGGGGAWISGKKGDDPAVLRRVGNRWERVPFTIERFEHLSVIVGDDGTAYLNVTQSVPKPPAPPGTVQTLELRTKSSAWRWSGSTWEDLSLPDEAYGILPGADGVIYSLGPDIRIHRRFDDTWTAVPLSEPVAKEPTSHAMANGIDVDTEGRLWISAVKTSLTGQAPGMWLLDGDTIREVGLEGKMRSASEVSSVSIAPDGAIWVAADRHVFLGQCG